MKRVIVLHIDRLVLKGFQQEDRQRIAEGLQQELQRLLGNTEAAERLASLRNVSRIRAGSASFFQGEKPEHLGASVATVIVWRLSP